MEGISSADQVVQDIKNEVEIAQKDVSSIIGKLSHHIKVVGIEVWYNYSTKRNVPGTVCNGPEVTIHYRIV